MWRKTQIDAGMAVQAPTCAVLMAYAWPALLAKDGDALFDHYRHTLEELGKQPGALALIFGKAQNKFDSRHLDVALTRWAH